MTFSGWNSIRTRLQQDNAVIERHRVEHDREASALVMWVGGADAYPGAAAIGFALHGVSDEHGIVSHGHEWSVICRAREGVRVSVAKADAFCESHGMDSDPSTPSELPQAYGAAFEAFTARWPSARQALGRALLCWLLDTPPMNSVRPRGPGGELEWRMITDAEWYAMRLALAQVIAAHSNDELILTVLALKDFHPTAYQHLPTDVIARLRSNAAA